MESEPGWYEPILEAFMQYREPPDNDLEELLPPWPPPVRSGLWFQRPPVLPAHVPADDDIIGACDPADESEEPDGHNDTREMAR